MQHTIRLYRSFRCRSDGTPTGDDASELDNGETSGRATYRRQPLRPAALVERWLSSHISEAVVDESAPIKLQHWCRWLWRLTFGQPNVTIEFGSGSCTCQVYSASSHFFITTLRSGWDRHIRQQQYHKITSCKDSIALTSFGRARLLCPRTQHYGDSTLAPLR